jgi:hypothetical protein
MTSISCKKLHFLNICKKDEKIALISVYEPKISEMDYQNQFIKDPQFILGTGQDKKIMTSPLSKNLKFEGFWCVKNLIDEKGK